MKIFSNFDKKIYIIELFWQYRLASSLLKNAVLTRKIHILEQFFDNNNLKFQR